MEKMKQGLDFYPVDVNFLASYPARALIRKCGLHAVLALMELLGRIYQWEGYFIRYDEELLFTMSDFLDIPQEEIDVIIRKAIDCKIFDQGMFEKHQILTSLKIQEVFIFATKRRKKIEMCAEYLLVVEKCIQNADLNPDDVCKNEQSKSKSKKIKEEVEEKEEKVIVAEELPLPPSPPPSNWKLDFNVYLKNLEQAYFALVNDDSYLRRKEKYYPGADISEICRVPICRIKGRKRYGQQVSQTKMLFCWIAWNSLRIRHRDIESGKWECCVSNKIVVGVEFAVLD